MIEAIVIIGVFAVIGYVLVFGGSHPAGGHWNKDADKPNDAFKAHLDAGGDDCGDGGE